MEPKYTSLINLDKLQIVGFLLSACVAFFLMFIGEDSIMSVTLGFVLASFVQLLDIQKRMSDAETRLLRSKRLEMQLAQDEWLFSRIEMLVAKYQHIHSFCWYEVFKLRAGSAIDECCHTLHRLADGQMSVGSGSPYNFGIVGIKLAKRSLHAVSLDDGRFWTSKWGETYLRANADAAASGVKVIRIFLNTSSVHEKLAPVIEQHQRCGIHVYLATVELAHKDLHDDFILMDDKLLNKAEYSGTGKIQSWRQSIEPLDIAEAQRKFNAILRIARRPNASIIGDS